MYEADFHAFTSLFFAITRIKNLPTTSLNKKINLVNPGSYYIILQNESNR